MVVKFLFNSALKFPLSALNCPRTRKNPAELNASISSSLSTINFTATDCTRPADNPGFTFFHSTGDNSNPTILSKIRRACCASTNSLLTFLGFSIAFKIADFVISLNVIRLVFSSLSPNVSYKCQEIASPSRSSSVANHIISAALTCFFKSATNVFLSGVTSYTGLKLLLMSTDNPFFARSRTWP